MKVGIDAENDTVFLELKADGGQTVNVNMPGAVARILAAQLESNADLLDDLLKLTTDD